VVDCAIAWTCVGRIDNTRAEENIGHCGERFAHGNCGDGAQAQREFDRHSGLRQFPQWRSIAALRSDEYVGLTEEVPQLHMATFFSGNGMSVSIRALVRQLPMMVGILRIDGIRRRANQPWHPGPSWACST